MSRTTTITTAMIAIVVLTSYASTTYAEPSPPAARERAIVKFDSSKSTWLTNDGHVKRDPVFWPGKDVLVFSVEDAKTGILRLVRLDLSTREVAPLLANNPASTRELSVSADGKVYVYNTVSGLSSKLKVIDQRTNREITLPHMGQANWQNWASVSPDGTHVLFVEAAHSIYEYDLVSNKGKQSIRRISRNAEFQSDYWPRYSPSGKKVVFASNRDGDFEIYSMASDGTGATRLTKSPGIDMHPIYSPDSKRIAFTSNRDGNYEIYVMQAEGGSASRLTRNPERDDFPAWHPNGKQIVMVSEHDGKFDLRLVDVP